MNPIYIVLEVMDAVPNSFTAYKTQEDAAKFFVSCIKENAELTELTEQKMNDCIHEGNFTEGSYEIYLMQSKNNI